MARILIRTMGVAGALALGVTACSSSTKGGATSSTTGAAAGSTPSSAAGKTIEVGVLTDSTGAASSGFTTTEQGIKAGIGVAAGKGYHIKYVMADTQSTPAGALAAAQKLVTQDHVFAVLSISSDFYGAASYLASQHVPVVGGGFDGPEWANPQSTNLFSVTGSVDYKKVGSTWGSFFKSQGVTKVGVLGYGISPSSSEAASGAAISSQVAGLSVGYQNLNFQFGSTNVQPVALAMKNAGVDGVYLPVVPNTAFALAAALKAEGVNLKAVVLATGYGGDLLQSQAGVAAGQGLDFATNAQPVDLNTAGTQQFQQALKQYANVTGVPTFAEYMGYLSVAGLVSGLQAAGSNPSQSSFTTALRKVSNFDGFGLYGSHTIDFGQFGDIAGGLGPGNCIYIEKLNGQSFSAVSGAAPICGSVIAGKTAQAGS